MERNKIYVGELNALPELAEGNNFANSIELVEITLREEVVYDADLSVAEKVRLARMLDRIGVPILQLHARGADAVIKSCRDAGVRARFEVICRPYHAYGFSDWRDEIQTVIDAGADIVHPSITTPRKWLMGEPSMTVDGVRQRAIDAVKYALDAGAAQVNVGFTDVPRTDMGFLLKATHDVVENGANTLILNDTVGVAKPASIRYLVESVKRESGGRVRVHCHDDFGLATANTLEALRAGADGAELCMNGADPARSGIAPLDEVVMALLCLYGVDLGYDTRPLSEAARMFADLTGMPLEEQKPITADRNWMYKRDHIMRTIMQDESIQFPFSPSLVGQLFHVGLGRGSGPVGVKAKLHQLNIDLPDEKLDELVEDVTRAAIERKRRLTDGEFVELAKSKK